MSTFVTMAEAQAKLPELVARLAGGEEIVITQDQQPVAKLVREQATGRKPRKAGSAKGKLVILQEDEEHLKDFEEYMQ
jgi:antitoxin (DNA-binding transcriptional repressor) of toxin-antitoxin stability system